MFSTLALLFAAVLAVSAENVWTPTAETLQIGDSQTGVYDGTTAWDDGAHCTGSFKAGTQNLGDYLKQNFVGISSVGGYRCDWNSANHAEMSVHGTGRAIDVMIATVAGDANNAIGDPIAKYLVENAQRLGVQLIIWDRKVWTLSRAVGKKFNTYTAIPPAVPHIDHLHVELTISAASRVGFLPVIANAPDAACSQKLGKCLGPNLCPDGDYVSSLCTSFAANVKCCVPRAGASCPLRRGGASCPLPALPAKTSVMCPSVNEVLGNDYLKAFANQLGECLSEMPSEFASLVLDDPCAVFRHEDYLSYIFGCYKAIDGGRFWKCYLAKPFFWYCSFASSSRAVTSSVCNILSTEVAATICRAVQSANGYAKLTFPLIPFNLDNSGCERLRLLLAKYGGVYDDDVQIWCDYRPSGHFLTLAATNSARVSLMSGDIKTFSDAISQKGALSTVVGEFQAEVFAAKAYVPPTTAMASGVSALVVVSVIAVILALAPWHKWVKLMEAWLFLGKTACTGLTLVFMIFAVTSSRVTRSTPLTDDAYQGIGFSTKCSCSGSQVCDAGVTYHAAQGVTVAFLLSLSISVVCARYPTLQRIPLRICLGITVALAWTSWIIFVAADLSTCRKLLPGVPGFSLSKGVLAWGCVFRIIESIALLALSMYVGITAWIAKDPSPLEATNDVQPLPGANPLPPGTMELASQPASPPAVIELDMEDTQRATDAVPPASYTWTCPPERVCVFLCITLFFSLLSTTSMTWGVSSMGEQIGLWTKCSCSDMRCSESNALLSSSAAFFIISFIILVAHAIFVFCHSPVTEAAFKHLSWYPKVKEYLTRVSQWGLVSKLQTWQSLFFGCVSLSLSLALLAGMIAASVCRLHAHALDWGFVVGVLALLCAVFHCAMEYHTTDTVECKTTQVVVVADTPYADKASAPEAPRNET